MTRSKGTPKFHDLVCCLFGCRYAVHKDYVADVAVVASKSTEHGFTILSASSDRTMKISKYPPL